jgi:large subunit ribosomal protein L25
MEITEATQLTLKVPFQRVGQSPMEKLGAKVEQHRDYLKVRCKASNIPSAIEFDMTPVTGEFAEIMVSEVTMPDGVEALYRKDFKIIRMKVSTAPAEEEGEESGEESSEE